MIYLSQVPGAHVPNRTTIPIQTTLVHTSHNTKATTNMNKTRYAYTLTNIKHYIPKGKLFPKHIKQKIKLHEININTILNFQK